MKVEYSQEENQKYAYCWLQTMMPGEAQLYAVIHTRLYKQIFLLLCILTSVKTCELTITPNLLWIKLTLWSYWWFKGVLLISLCWVFGWGGGVWRTFMCGDLCLIVTSLEERLWLAPTSADLTVCSEVRVSLWLRW